MELLLFPREAKRDTFSRNCSLGCNISQTKELNMGRKYQLRTRCPASLPSSPNLECSTSSALGWKATLMHSWVLHLASETCWMDLSKHRKFFRPRLIFRNPSKHSRISTSSIFVIDPGPWIRRGLSGLPPVDLPPSSPHSVRSQSPSLLRGGQTMLPPRPG